MLYAIDHCDDRNVTHNNVLQVVDTNINVPCQRNILKQNKDKIKDFVPDAKVYHDSFNNVNVRYDI